MDSYFQAILLGLGAGLLTGTTVFIANWGIRVALRILEIV